MAREAKQRNDIRTHLKRGLSLTPLQALRLYDCFRLAAVVHYLRHEELLDIKKKMVFNKSTKKIFAMYYMEMVIQLNEHGKIPANTIG